MTKDEALKLALEALENYKSFIDDAHIIEGQYHWLNGSSEAITAIKEALAQTSTQCEKQPAQEPDEISTEELIYAAGVYDGKKKRPWVGLTEDEVMDVFKERNALKFAAAIEAKLKEKNT